MSELTTFLRQNRTASVFGVLILVLVLSIGWNLVSGRTDAVVEALHRQGYPVTLEELNAYYAPVPADKNFALACEQVFANVAVNQRVDDWFRKTNSVEVKQAKLSAENRAFLESILTKNQTALEALHSLPAHDRSRYSLDFRMGSATLLPHLATLKQSVALLVMEAMVLNEEGASDEAIGSLTIAGRLADSLGQEPILISYLVRIAAWNTIVSGLEQMVNSASLTEPQLGLLQALLERVEQNQELTRVVAGERAFGLSLFIDRQERDRVFSGGGRITPGSKDVWLRDLAFAFYKASGFFQRDKSFYLANLAAVQQAALQPFPARFQQGTAVAGNVPTNRFFLISRLVLPAWGRAFGRDAENVARLRVAQSALAVERFRLAHKGELPDGLENLVPQYAKSNPIDPIDGAPLRFKKLKTGYVIYSIGADGKDDTSGGLPVRKSTSAPDIVFGVSR